MPWTSSIEKMNEFKKNSETKNYRFRYFYVLEYMYYKLQGQKFYRLFVFIMCVKCHFKLKLLGFLMWCSCFPKFRILEFYFRCWKLERLHYLGSICEYVGVLCPYLKVPIFPGIWTFIKFIYLRKLSRLPASPRSGDHLKSEMLRFPPAVPSVADSLVRSQTTTHSGSRPSSVDDPFLTLIDSFLRVDVHPRRSDRRLRRVANRCVALGRLMKGRIRFCRLLVIHLINLDNTRIFTYPWTWVLSLCREFSEWSAMKIDLFDVYMKRKIIILG